MSAFIEKMFGIMKGIGFLFVYFVNPLFLGVVVMGILVCEGFG